MKNTLLYKSSLIVFLALPQVNAQKLINFVSINDFGAIPNDNKDDSEAVRKALEVNGLITMNRGVYNVHGITRLHYNTSIYGNGSTFIGELDTTSSKNILTLQGEKIIIKDLLLDGAYTKGNAKEGRIVSSLLHIYDSSNILLENLNTLNHVSNWWNPKVFNFSQLNTNHEMDMYHVIYIGFSKNITISNMEQKGNLKTEGLLIYESDKITIQGFKSKHSPKIWTSLNIIASDDITLNNIEVADGKINEGGSSINFIANHNFIVKNTKTSTKQGFDISNELRGSNSNQRVSRDTSYGIFENCHFEGQRAFYGYPIINKSKELVFKNTKFIPTKEGYATWGMRIQKAEGIRFENCTFGSKKNRTIGMIIGDTKDITITNCNFINPSIGIYLFGKKFGKLYLENNLFNGKNYSPITFYWNKSYIGEGILSKFYFRKNISKGKLLNNNFFNIKGNFKIEKIIH